MLLIFNLSFSLYYHFLPFLFLFLPLQLHIKPVHAILFLLLFLLLIFISFLISYLLVNFVIILFPIDHSLSFESLLFTNYRIMKNLSLVQILIVVLKVFLIFILSVSEFLFVFLTHFLVILSFLIFYIFLLLLHLLSESD